MTAIGIELISVFGMPPAEFVRLSAGLGCQHVSMGLSGSGLGVGAWPDWSLRDDAALRRELKAALAATGIAISLGEGLMIRPGVAAADYAGDLDIFAELGVGRINTVSMDADLARSFDAFGAMAELAAARGMVTTTEFAPALAVPDLPTALAAVAHVGRADFRLLIDTMHLGRSGAGAADVAAIDPALIDYVQVSDAPRQPRFDSYFEEAMFERMVPREGELGVAEILAALPADRIYALEVPLRTRALAGVPAEDRLRPCVAALRALLEDAHGADRP